MTLPVLGVIAFAGLVLIFNIFKILKEYERGVIFRLGRLIGAKGPGLIILIPMIDKMVRVDLRVITYDVPPQDVITKDNVSIKVNAVLYFQITDSNKAIVSVANFFEATNQIAQTTLRSVLGQVELDDLLANRDKINAELQQIIDEQTEPWGIKVSVVEVKNVDLPLE
ncbi:MAG: SPFH domain-containing protein, partial [candidate division Zixibacteria bacterium]|nr:SPFH domain-containing protein [candidate division Zixibacteria bacterium]